MHTLSTTQFLKAVSGGHHEENTEDKIKCKAEEMKDTINEGFRDLDLPKVHVDHCHHHHSK
jgi:hypothetical protein